MQTSTSLAQTGDLPHPPFMPTPLLPTCPMHGGPPRPLSLLAPSPRLPLWSSDTRVHPGHVAEHNRCPSTQIATPTPHSFYTNFSPHSLVAICHRTSPTRLGPSTVSTVCRKTCLGFVLSDNICLLMSFMWVERFSLVHELELSNMRYKDYVSTKGDDHHMGDLLGLAIWKRFENRRLLE